MVNMITEPGRDDIEAVESDCNFRLNLPQYWCVQGIVKVKGEIESTALAEVIYAKTRDFASEWTLEITFLSIMTSAAAAASIHLPPSHSTPMSISCSASLETF